MKWQKVKMIVEFEVPVGREAYGSRTHNDLPWKEYAEHDMESHTVDYDGRPRYGRAYDTVEEGEIEFEWGKEFEKEEEE